MKKIYIINNKYLTEDGDKLSIGGVESYIHNLCSVIIDMGYSVEIYQISSRCFCKEYDGVRVHGIVSKTKTFVKSVLKLIPKHNVVIFANDEIVYGRYDGITVNIQHGIGWDLQEHQYRGRALENIYELRKWVNAKHRINRAQKANCVVCVDYNYINWFRTQVDKVNPNYYVIPNFSEIPESLYNKPMNELNIIFARRFTSYRGTRIVGPALRKIIDEYKNITVTFAGTGPDEQYLRDLFPERNVEFVQYGYNESIITHKDKHIAIVPSVGSEGTSLSLLEAMASGCAVICTNVGGMTNIVLNGYNGIMVSPTESEVYQAIKEMIDDPKLRDFLSRNAYETVKAAFSKENWEAQWRHVIKSVML